MSKHTLGPWKAQSIGDAFYIESLNGLVAETKPRLLNSEEEEANAHLIASAPELLEALVFVTEELRGYASEYDGPSVGTSRKISAALSAIAKAKGESA